jgi:hypothetical protein
MAIRFAKSESGLRSLGKLILLDNMFLSLNLSQNY